MNKIRKDTDRTLIDRSLISAIRSSDEEEQEAFYFWQSSQPLSKNEIFLFVLFSRVECGRPHDSSHSLCAQAYRNMTERGAARTAPPDLQQILSVTAEESFAETIVPSDVNVSSDAAIQQLLQPGDEESDEEDQQDDGEGSDGEVTGEAGTSSSTNKAPLAAPSDGKKQYAKNRPPFVKEDPEECKANGQTPTNFTFKELKHCFSSEVSILKRYRVTRSSRFVEDGCQARTHHLPFGLRLHRRVGYGARRHKKDGLAGFVSMAGMTVYKVTRVEYDERGRIRSLYGIGRDKKLTKAWVWH